MNDTAHLRESGQKNVFREGTYLAGWYKKTALLLDLSPDAIREATEGEFDLSQATDDDLAEIGMDILESDALYRVFHELLTEKIKAYFPLAAVANALNKIAKDLQDRK